MSRDTLEAKSLMVLERSSMEIGSEHTERTSANIKPTSRPNDCSFSYGYNDIFFLLTRGQSHVYVPPVPPPRSLYFSSFYEPYVIEAFRASPSSNKRKPTGIQSDDGAHIDEGSLLLLLSPPAVAIARKRPRFRVSFFSSEPIFNLRAAAAPAIAGPE